MSHDPRPNLASLLTDLELADDEPAFVRRTPFRRFAWTRGETRRAALALSDRLKGAGVTPGERVLLAGPDSPEWVAAFLGIAAAGGVTVPLDAATPPDLVRRIVAKTRARAAVVPAADRAALEAQVGKVVPLEELEALRAHSGPLHSPYLAAPDETAEIVFTSGTTSEPKGVELSHRNLLASVAGIEAGFRRRQAYLRPLLPMRFLCLVPLSHLFGQSLGIAIPILMRSTAIFSSSLEPGRLLRLVRDEHPIAIVTVPRVLAGLAEALRRELGRRGKLADFERGVAAAEGRGFLRRLIAGRAARSVVGWRSFVVVVGGAALDPELESFWTRCGFLVIQGYGMTEAAPIITIANPLDGKAHTLGRPVSHVEVRLAEDGEVLVRGPNVMKGYYADPDATRAAFQDGWLRTGDLAERDLEGRLHFRGRKKELIVLPSGLNVAPSDVEAALGRVAGVREAVAFAGKGPSGEEVHAAVLATSPFDAERARLAANELLLPHQRIRRLVVWDPPDFPRTSIGKVRRGEVAALSRALASLEGEPHAAVEAAGGRVAGALARLKVALRASPEAGARLGADLGLDSLEVLDLLSLLEEETGVSLAAPSGAASLTVGGLERLLDEERGPARTVPMPRFARRGPFRALRAVARIVLLRPLYGLFVRLEVDGRANAREVAGPCIVVANHTSMLDAPTVAFALPRDLRGRISPAMAIETLPDHFEPVGKPWHRRLRSGSLYAIAAGLFGAYPLPQSQGFRPSLEYTGELLDAGLLPLVFPEGRMTRTGRMLPFKSGIGLLVRETRCAVLPVHLTGLAEILPPDARWPRGRGRAVARIGPVLRFDDPAGLEAGAIARRVEAAVRALGSLPEKSRDRGADGG